MKKILLATAVTTALGLGAFQLANANPAWYQAFGGCRNCEVGADGPLPRAAMNEELVEARDKFLQETAGLRKELTVKEAELTALMAAANPDDKKVGKVTGEIFDLRSQLKQAATAKGLPGRRPGHFRKGFYSGGHGMWSPWNGRLAGFKRCSW